MIVLLGYMGVGKSSVSKQLAAKLGCKFIDLDHYIEMRENKSITAIFKQKGEIYFRKIEHLYLKELLNANTFDIIALGGGTPCYANNMDLINSGPHQSFYLKMNLDSLTERLFQIKENRPLLSHIATLEDLNDFVRKHLFERQFYYQQAKHTIDVSSLTVEEIVNRIKEELK